jgi:hypothetical protein
MLEDGECFFRGWQMLKRKAGFAPRGVPMQTSTVESEGECPGARFRDQVPGCSPVETVGGPQVPGPLREDRSVCQRQVGQRACGILSSKR